MYSYSVAVAIQINLMIASFLVGDCVRSLNASLQASFRDYTLSVLFVRCLFDLFSLHAGRVTCFITSTNALRHHN